MAVTWEVVGADFCRDGLVVRSDSSVASEARPGRLAVGAVVKELDLCNDRLHYVLVSGDGPEIGWVSTRLRGRDLLVREGEKLLCPERSSHYSKEECNRAAGEAKKDPKEEEYAALNDYERKFGVSLGDHDESINHGRLPWKGDEHQQATQEETPAEAVEAALAFKGKRPKKRVQTLCDIDSDGEDIPLCACCFMPVGEFAYRGASVERLPPHTKAANQKKCVHSECMALLMVDETQLQEEERVKTENKKKLANRARYGIGWRMDSVPKNAAIAQRLGCSPVPNGLCCLVYDEAARTVRIAATHEPAASVNLEYLMLALKVRREFNREPLFSLDPVDETNLSTTLQRKRYEPSWLAGTSVGDVMFHADYFLKELSLGEYTMPVVGMLSVIDMADVLAETWSGREWFVVKKAEVRMAADQTLIPHVKMGVEAREQILINARLEDKAVTQPNHPLKKFADSFTRNFDLISERKSVIYHLRELAKASVMAKFLLDSKANIDSNWYQVADAIVNSTKPEAHPEIPQLWNMRGNSRIQLKDGHLECAVTGVRTALRGVYGGVQFGLDKFQLSQRPFAPGAQLPTKASLSRSMGRMSTQAMQIGPGSGGRQLFVPERFQIGQRGEMPQGVDLNLDEFSLSELDRFSGTLPACSAPLDSREGRLTLGRAFLEKLHEGSLLGLKEDDKAFLKALFNPALSDRAGEGNDFNPPDPDLKYVAKVRNLVNEEKCILQRRKLQFFNKSFNAINPGPEFPICWASRVQIEEGGQARQLDKLRLLEVQVDAAFQQILLTDVLPSAAPEFHKSTEDGVTFRIYRLGSLEIRTTQEPNCEEMVGAVFSRRAPALQLRSGTKAGQVQENEMVVKAKVYTEVAESDARPQADAKPVCHFYVVLETNTASTIVAEQLQDESISWAVDPSNLEDRNSLAKLLFAAEPANFEEAPRVQQLKDMESARSSKAYAKALLKLMSDYTFRGKWGGKERREPILQLPAGRSELPTLPSSFLVCPELEKEVVEQETGTWDSKKGDALRKMREPRRQRGFGGL
eukprot:TRINITY_DN22427_c0_g1_i1.p1 TRINITY_DN22427_c0_g1~~TRINITY_DN22427_c0_g1_i1.p1  ORF type:complete len:1043 (-),score=216.13 TRINITY_DN22427_c0_g1_i1:272-3376(-)